MCPRHFSEICPVTRPRAIGLKKSAFDMPCDISRLPTCHTNNKLSKLPILLTPSDVLLIQTMAWRSSTRGVNDKRKGSKGNGSMGKISRRDCGDVWRAIEATSFREVPAPILLLVVIYQENYISRLLNSRKSLSKTIFRLSSSKVHQNRKIFSMLFFGLTNYEDSTKAREVEIMRKMTYGDDVIY